MKVVQLEYQCHLQGLGNSGWLPEGTPLGTQGESRRLESFVGIRLRGEEAPVQGALLVQSERHSVSHGPALGRSDVRHEGGEPQAVGHAGGVGA
ncbi:hypothetical protein [Corallococcus sp. AS-1-6]|uniref:hypothetical protein n=1 Tax=Corallococcus TaxID=83461 RepID=UPI001CBD696A|nr:hypothetical protein [Corallococcus sp. AS-1-6]